MSKAQQKGLQAPNLFQSCRIWNNVYLVSLVFLVTFLDPHSGRAPAASYNSSAVARAMELFLPVLEFLESVLYPLHYSSISS